MASKQEAKPDMPDAPWGIISIKAQDEAHELPMQPITMMRNAGDQSRERGENIPSGGTSHVRGEREYTCRGVASASEQSGYWGQVGETLPTVRVLLQGSKAAVPPRKVHCM
eukprot:3541791-Pyramimonas_sp.AAC.1